MSRLERKLKRATSQAEVIRDKVKELTVAHASEFSVDRLSQLEALASDLSHVCSELDDVGYDLGDYHHIDDCDDYYDERECTRKHVDDDVDSDLVVASKNAVGMFYKLRGRVAPVDESMDDYQIRMVFDNLRDTIEGEPNYARLDQHKTLQVELD